MSLPKRISDWKIRHPGAFPSSLKSTAKAWFHLTRRWRALPDFLIIGAPKCGTTSFFSYLAQHPRIVPAMDKEPAYLRYHNFSSLEKYRACFPLRRTLRPGRLTGEGTTHYLYDASVARRLETDLPRAKLFLLLRDPVQRALSHYHHNLRQQREKRPPEEVFEGLLRLYGTWQPGNPLPTVPAAVAASDYVKYGLYAEFLQPWLPLLRSGRLTVILFEEFIRNPPDFMRDAFFSLGIESDDELIFRVFNEGKSKEKMNPKSEDLLREFYSPFQPALEAMLKRPVGWPQR